jgi:hypothetical protein
MVKMARAIGLAHHGFGAIVFAFHEAIGDVTLTRFRRAFNSWS